MSRKGKASFLEAGRGKGFPACEPGKGHCGGCEATANGSQESGTINLLNTFVFFFTFHFLGIHPSHGAVESSLGDVEIGQGTYIVYPGLGQQNHGIENVGGRGNLILVSLLIHS